MAGTRSGPMAPASAMSDLGLGGILKKQLEGDLLERKKKKAPSPVESLMSPAASMLLGGWNTP